MPAVQLSDFSGSRFGLPPVERRDLRVRLFEPVRHSLCAAGGFERRGVEAIRGVDHHRARRSARIGERRGKLRQAVQLAEVRRAETLRVRAAECETVNRLPAHADLARDLAAEGRVVRPAHCAAEVERRQHREAELAIHLVYVIRRVDRRRERILRFARLAQRIGQERALVFAVFDTDCEARRAIGDVEHVTGDVGGEQRQFLRASGRSASCGSS